MKKAISLLLLLCMLLSVFSACSGDGQSTSSLSRSSTAAGPERSPQSIVLWHSMTEEAGAEMDAYVKAFNEGPGKDLNITVEAVFQGAYADSTTKMRTILQNNQVDQLPDVIQIDATGVVDYKSSEHTYTVDDALANDPAYDMSQIVEAPLKAWSFDGVQLGMPFNSSTTVMYYNKTILDAAGVAVPPTTFAEIIDAAAKLPAKNAAGADLAVYAAIPNTPTLANWIGQIPGARYGASYVVDNRNGRDGSAAKLVCDTEGTLEKFLTGWKSMYDAGALKNQGDALTDMFTAEQLVFLTTSTSNTRSLLETIGGRFELGCAYYPRIDASSNYGATISGSAMFMFNKNNNEKAQAAWEFLKFLASAEIQAWFSVSTGYFPINRGAYEQTVYKEFVAQYPQMEVGTKQIEQTSPDMMGVTVGPSRDFYLEIQNQVSEMLTTGASPADTAAKMSAALNRLLEEYHKANP